MCGSMIPELVREPVGGVYVYVCVGQAWLEFYKVQLILCPSTFLELLFRIKVTTSEKSYKESEGFELSIPHAGPLE